MKLFLDTNVILDTVLQRENYLSASILLSLCDAKEVNGCASILTMANVAYIARKGRNRDDLKAILADLSAMLTVLSMDSKQWEKALSTDAPDLEDVLQYECAKANDCDIIITNNVKHFRFSDIKVMTAKEFLDTIDGDENEYSLSHDLS